MREPGSWQEANQIAIVAALQAIRFALLRHTGQEVDESCRAASDGAPMAATLERLCAQFELSRFECATLLLCAGVELDDRFAQACAAAQGDPKKTYATFGLALAALPDAHWSALVRQQPLRFWKLIDVAPGDALVTSPLRIDERVLHFLTGVDCMDERLEPLLRPLDAGDTPAFMAGTVDAIAAALGATGRPARRVLLSGGSPRQMQSVAASAFGETGIAGHLLRAEDIPVQPAERETLARLWNRETRLTSAGLYLACGDAGAETLRHADAFLEQLEGPCIVEQVEGHRFRGLDAVDITLRAADAQDRRKLWRESLGAAAAGMEAEIESVADHFAFDANDIRRAGDAVHLAGDDAGPRETLWRVCRERARGAMQQLARRIDAKADWDSLVLPPAQIDILSQIVTQLRGRAKVHERWGFAEKYARGLGMTALFAGASGTGKTMAAEVLARSLDLDLYQIDLAATVSKYIGETEKNLKRVFDAAEEGGAILLFDEADALFGKRTEVKDSHDRYANLEVSYLLQRMEAYRGLAILTTNMRRAIDAAFLRRIRFVVSFPFPSAAERARIWRAVFPARTPLADVDFEKLARLNVAGGVIRNIATNAAFLAADHDDAVRMTHLLQAARVEYAKLEKPLTDSEVGSWT